MMSDLVDVIYLYFQKTFDKLPHQRILLKLKSHYIYSFTLPEGVIFPST